MASFASAAQTEQAYRHAQVHVALTRLQCVLGQPSPDLLALLDRYIALELDRDRLWHLLLQATAQERLPTRAAAAAVE
ncbi:hypothetical protein [Hymenobacter sp. AT01-02]|uniref:hypothetical protein n=1 Tax=Hymenobacter sp. AT01-02 TaxID=1571877 RepID=UPI0006E331C0|nr:hypothetical protein [Hymenobacter sp. AT01-02]